MTGTKLKIAMVSYHGCIRVLKETMALRKLGHDVHLIVEKLPFGYDRFTSTAVYIIREQLQSTIAHYARDVDLFHVHNEPDSLVWDTKDAAGNVPVIYDIHDLDHLRWRKADGTCSVKEGEIRAMNACDGVVHVSEACQAEAWKYHDPKPDTVVYSWQNEEFLARDEDIVGAPCYESLVYEGGIDSTEAPERVSEKAWRFNIRNFIPIMRAFREEHFAISILSAMQLKNFAYEEMGCAVYRPLIYPAMLQALRPHGIGLVGCPLSTPLMENAMPNKLFEYISQGVVPVSVNAEEVERFLMEHDCGIVLPGDIKQPGDGNGWSGLREAILPEAPKKRANLLRLRRELTMERQVHKLVNLYEEVLG